MPEPIINIVLVGRTGNGKSTTGNTILGDKLFKSGNKAVGVTQKCEIYRAAIQDGPIINVIDTPGLFDSARTEESLSKEITNCLTMAEGGIHAVLLVLSARARISQEEEYTLNRLQCIFDGKILDYFIIVFTGGDDFEENNETLDDYLGDCPEFFTNALRLCGGRKVLFNNRTKDKNKKAEQLSQLLAHVADVGIQTGGIPYTFQMHLKIKKETEKLREQEREIEHKKRVEAEEEEKLQMEIKYKNLMDAKIAEVQEKLRMDHEENMREFKEEEKLRMEHNSKNLAEAKRKAKEERLRLENDKRELIALLEKGNRLKEEEQRRVESSKKTWMIYARDLGISWSENSQYWSWLPLQYETSSQTLVEAALLEKVCWLHVSGKFDTRGLTPDTKYEVVYVVKLKDTASGWETPVNLKLAMPNSRGAPQEQSVRLKELIGKGWVDIPAGEFMMSRENAGEISFSMIEIASGFWKTGLFVKGVEIRPKN